MSQEHLDPVETEQELTAYLDGELDGPSVRRVEERLARDPAYQAELQRLERTWDLLDGLPRSSVDENFTKGTIEMVALAASEDAASIESQLPAHKRRERVRGALGVLAAGLIGFAAGHWLYQNPNQRLLRDLPVLENLDLYYQADNVEFLRLLDQEDLFNEGDAEHAG